MTHVTGSCIITHRAAVKADTFIPSGRTSNESKILMIIVHLNSFHVFEFVQLLFLALLMDWNLFLEEILYWHYSFI